MLRRDVLKQAIASLASFMGGVNYSDSFHVAASAQRPAAVPLHSPSPLRPGAQSSAAPADPEAEPGAKDNPLYDAGRMTDCVAHANANTMAYGVEIMSINILAAVPTDNELTHALSGGAVASAQAQQAETAARGNAKAMAIDAEARASQKRIQAKGLAEAAVIEAEAAQLVADGQKQAAELLATSDVAVDLAKMER